MYRGHQFSAAVGHSPWWRAQIAAETCRMWPARITAAVAAESDRAADGAPKATNGSTTGCRSCIPVRA